MARIVSVLWPEPGHVNPVLQLARQLSARGHQLIHLTDRVMLAHYRTNGQTALDLPDEIAAAPVAAPSRAQELYACIKRDSAEVVRYVASLRPDLVMIDPLMWRLSLVLTHAGMPCLHVSTSLPDELDPNVPPWDSHHVPAPGPASWLIRRLEWCRVFFERWLKYDLGLPIHTDVNAPLDISSFLRASSWPEAWVQQRAFHKPALGLTDLVLCPPCFEYPFKSARANRYYVEACIDRERFEAEDCLEELDRQKPLIVAALGTQSFRYADAAGILDRLMDAARELPEYQFAIAAGDRMSEIRNRPPNVLLRRQLPQLRLLARASAMVTHGGLGSIKECVAFGVPMCVVPFRYDQPSVAARVDYHGIGLVLRPQAVSPARFVAALRRLVDAPQYRARVRLMQREFAEAEARGLALRVIEALLGNSTFIPEGRAGVAFDTEFVAEFSRFEPSLSPAPRSPRIPD